MLEPDDTVRETMIGGDGADLYTLTRLYARLALGGYLLVCVRVGHLSHAQIYAEFLKDNNRN